VAPSDPTTLPFSAAQAMVDAIWSDMGCVIRPQSNPSLDRPGLPCPRGQSCACSLPFPSARIGRCREVR
jgi:hypothetical protein